MGHLGAGDQLFEREVRKVLDKVSGKDRDKYIKMLKSQYKDRIDHINTILEDYK
jgi:hypothetical protein